MKPQKVFIPVEDMRKERDYIHTVIMYPYKEILVTEKEAYVLTKEQLEKVFEAARKYTKYPYTSYDFNTLDDFLISPEFNSQPQNTSQ